jgi:hypothetical protein
MGKLMIDESEPELARSFAKAREALDDDTFAAGVLAAMASARRRMLWMRWAAIGAAVIAMICVGPVIGPPIGALLLREAGDYSALGAGFLVTPLGWAMSMLIGVWVLARARRRS